MKNKTLTQFITLSVMLAVLFLLVSLMPTQNINDATNASHMEQQATKVGLLQAGNNQRQN